MPGVVTDDAFEEEFEEMGMFPLTDIDSIDPEDADFVQNEQNNQQTLNNGWKPVMTLKQRRHRKLSAVPDVDLFMSRQAPLSSISSAEMDSTSPSPFSPDTPSPKLNWLNAFRKIKTMRDPWAKYRIQDLKSERAVRHRYNAVKKKWEMDEIVVKLEEEVNFYQLFDSFHMLLLPISLWYYCLQNIFFW